MTCPSHTLERTVTVQAAPETVFSFFTDSGRWARWWGPGSAIDARPGGKLLIRHPNNVETVGEVLELRPPERIVFTYGYASGKPIPPGASRVTIRLEPSDGGCRLHLLHEFQDADARDQHVQGWRFQLSLFANVVADEVYAGAGDLVDQWFETWMLADDAIREQAFERLAAPDLRFRDRFSLLEGVADLSAHAGAAHRFMPGMRLQRKGTVRHCQGAVLADWVALAADGTERMSGSSVFLLRPDRRFQSVTSFANPPASR